MHCLQLLWGKINGLLLLHADFSIVLDGAVFEMSGFCLPYIFGVRIEEVS